ncbi:MAG: sulfotransferase family protein [Roseococcus sp.]|nr:sulfotransferase family protein [Roseococcus sp.]
MTGDMPSGLPLRALPLYIFLHVPKTAGTSARQMFRWMTGDFYFMYVNERHQPRPGGRAAWEEPGFFDRYLMIGGHFDITHPIVQTARSTGRRVIFLGVVRDPVARVVSLYDFVRRQPTHPLHAELAQRSLLEAVQQGGSFLRSYAVNAQLLQLFGTADPDRIEEVLAQENFVLGRQDALEAFFDAVAAVSGLPRPRRVPRANTAEKLDGPQATPAREQPGFEEAKARLAELNRAEVEFLGRRIPRLLITARPRPVPGLPSAA